MNKPTKFKELLELQRVLDEEINKNRNNGFIPRERSLSDILFAIDDEFQEWLKELPYEYNFKTWKQKEYSREKELEELTDVLFFFLQYCHFEIELLEPNFELMFDNFGTKGVDFSTKVDLMYLILEFKEELWSAGPKYCFNLYLWIVYKRGFTKEDLLETYWKKWQTNITRINGDWTL